MKALTLQSTDLMRLTQSVWTQRAIRAINLMLVIWIAWLLATLTWSLISGPVPVETTPVETDVAPVKVSPHQQLVKQIPQWHLFGEAKQAAAPVKPSVPVDAPDTHLKLVLRGAFSSDAPQFARAIIADQRGKEEMYAVGDQVPGNAELREIHVDRVILMRGGRFETLRLPRNEKTSPGGARAAARSRSYRPAGGASRSQQLGSIRQSLKQNPKSLYGLVRTTPKKDDAGKMMGYTVEPGRDPGLFEQMGLQSGDVVTKINDISLDNLSNGARALKSAQSGESVTLTVMRGDQEETLSFSVPE